MNIQSRVSRFRSRYGEVWNTPTPMDCWNFVVQEVAEIGDCLLRNGYGQRNDYFRMHSRFEGESAMTREIGDALIMLCSLATLVGVDIEDAVGMALAEKERKINNETN